MAGKGEDTAKVTVYDIDLDWDGLDEAGRPVAMGTYYVKVQDDRGHVGWGKVMSLGGRP